MVVARYGVILEIPPHHRLQPLQGVRDGLVPALLQLRLDFFQLGRHALPDGLSLDHEEARLLARPTDVSETQKVDALMSKPKPELSGKQLQKWLKAGVMEQGRWDETE